MSADELTPAMRAALDVMRNNSVTYAYRPMPRALNRPLPVRSCDLAPVYSHGLNGGTVSALLRRSLVTLSPIDQHHGRVLPAAEE
jgi:hypothetical protein